jgi:hypothetical protein
MARCSGSFPGFPPPHVFALSAGPRLRYTHLAVITKTWDQHLAPFHLDAPRRWRTLAILGWTVVCMVLIGMFVAKPDKVTGFAPYLKGAAHWVEGVDMYSNKPNKGFVYSPLAAVFFVPFTWVPSAVANVLWRLLSVGCLLGGLWSMLRFGPFHRIPIPWQGLVFLLLLPLSLSNLDSGQANPIVIGLIMAGLAAACQGRWTLAALALAGAVHWKIYPLVVGLLLMVVAPRRFSWRFILLLALMAAIPFLFQKTDYVLEQYREWIATRTADNRLRYALEIAPLDLWFLAVRVLGLPLSELAYHALRALTGAALAGFCLVGRLRNWPVERLYGGLFAFVCTWMVLLGPASEWLTYLLVAPATALAVVEVLSPSTNRLTRMAAFAAYGILLAAVLRVGFFPKFQSGWLLALQPIGALMYLVFAARRYLPPRLSPQTGE